MKILKYDQIITNKYEKGFFIGDTKYCYTVWYNLLGLKTEKENS